MADAVLLFTFSPVQPFIAEARRASDLFAGSRILVELAKAAAQAVRDFGGQLVFPVALGDDMPNRLVATVPTDRAAELAQAAQKALLARWEAIAASARQHLWGYGAEHDATWDEVWGRQIRGLWEVYWAVAPMNEDEASYAGAYHQATRALNAAKRTRAFPPAEEPGLKDSLSGRREALHTASLSAVKYWDRVGRGKGMTAALLRPEGRERLDAIGAIKRFSDLRDERRFLSTSTVASEEFLGRARGLLAPYRRAIEALIPEEKLYRVRGNPEWPYDGDLFYAETLTPERLLGSYGVEQPDAGRLGEAQRALGELHRQVGGAPSPYYAVVVLDGDEMGKRIDQCLAEPGRAQQRHRELSQQLSNFASEVPQIVNAHQGSLIYNGGDDVLVLVPLAAALPLVGALAQAFAADTGGTASAGIAIVHHLSPLDAALGAARAAEQAAKNSYGRSAVCVRALKRSGEAVQVGSQWSVASAGETAGSVVDLLEELIAHFRADRLSSRFAYEIAEQAAVATALPDPAAREALLRRLVERHRTAALSKDAGREIGERLARWASLLDRYAPSIVDRDTARVPQGLAELGRWLVLARFIAEGGSD